MNVIMEFFTQNGWEILRSVGQHLYMTVLSVGWAIIIGVPAGIICSYFRRVAQFIMGVTNITQAIPSLAVLGLLIPFLGIGSTPAIIMVTTYSLLPIVKNTYAGIVGIDPDILEAADGIGIKRWERLIYVELPLAFPIIMSGIRIAAVTAIGSMTIAAYVGGGGLGTLIFEGIGMVNYPKILMGAIPAALLALLIDSSIQRLETLVDNRRSKSKMVKKKLVIIFASAAVIFAGIWGFNTFKPKADLVIGSKNYPEQVLLGNMYAELIEHYTDLVVERQLSLGGTDFVFQAITSDNIDGYMEYTGSAYLTYLGNTYNQNDTAASIFLEVKEQLAAYGIVAFDPLGFGNSWSLGVTEEFAKEKNLETLSDLAAISSEIDFVSTISFMQRADGGVGMTEAYGFDFKSINNAEDILRYQAIASNQADAIEIYTTDGMIARYNIKVLADDREFFAPYDVFPMMKADVLKEHPEIADIMARIAGKITEADMQELNYRVVVEAQPSEQVARDYLEEKNWFA